MHLANARPSERVIRRFTVSTRYGIIQLLAGGGVVAVRAKFPTQTPGA